jgi:predicted HAD superfamily phosphohydrolase
VKTRHISALFIFATLTLSTAPSFAQATDATPEQREALQLRIDELRTRLALTSEQEARIAPLIQARNEKLKALRDSTDPNASRREKLSTLKEARAIQQELVAQVEPLLSKEQKKEWEVIRKEMREVARERMREKR